MSISAWTGVAFAPVMLVLVTLALPLALIAESALVLTGGRQRGEQASFLRSGADWVDVFAGILLWVACLSLLGLPRLAAFFIFTSFVAASITSARPAA